MIGKPRLHRVTMALLHRANPRIVVDIDDAMWTWGEVFAQRFDDGARRARTITAGNGYLRRAASERYPGTAVELIPAAVALDHYPARVPHADVDPVVVGWIGGPASLGDFTEPVAAALRASSTRASSVCGSCAANRSRSPVSPPSSTRGRSTRRSHPCRAFDIGIMPLGDDEEAQGRCGLKAVQCMAVGVPVVASPVGAAAEIVEPGVTGFLADTEQEWTDALSRARSIGCAPLAHGAAARRRVADEFSVTANTPRLLTALESSNRAANRRG